MTTVNFENLPFDIYLEISKTLPIKHTHLLLLTSKKIFYKTPMHLIIHNRLDIISSRIILFFKLKKKINKLFDHLRKCINTYYKFSDSGMFVSQFNINCMLYSPITQYGTCRFCGQNAERHRYRKMISLYLKIIINEST